MSFIQAPIKETPLYLLQFTPILKEKVWGGQLLHQVFNKKSESNNIGESWELSAVSGDVSMVSEGALAHTSLQDLIQQYTKELVGNKVYQRFGNTFPLLFKFIDAREDLSVQLHPDDTLAKRRHDSFGKTEMWYIMHAEKDARLILGFKEKMIKDRYQQVMEAEDITAVLHSEKVEKGDAFYIAPGTVHAIGAGVLLAEIQQTSDITYRIFDWNRPGTDGHMRQLHTEEALDAINYEPEDPKLQYSPKENQAVQLKSTPYFETNVLKLSNEVNRDLKDKDSFIVYMCTEGRAHIQTEKSSVMLEKGQTVLVPACLAKVLIKSESATLLEVYIP